MFREKTLKGSVSLINRSIPQTVLRNASLEKGYRTPDPERVKLLLYH